MLGVVVCNIGAAVLDVFSFTLLIPFLNALFGQPPLSQGPGLVTRVLTWTVGRLLDPADQRRACARHLFIPDLVPGEVSDAGEDFVSYRMRDGSLWTNDAREEEAAAC